MTNGWKTIYWIFGGLIILGLVFVGLNAVSIWDRVIYLIGYNDPLENNIVQRASSGAGVLVDDPVKFPEIFVSPENQQIQEVYARSYENNHLYIPSLGIDAPIVYLNSVDEMTLQAELKKGVGHYPDTAMPGEVGNVFLFGHSSYYWWDWSEYSAIFANLESIQLGDRILVYYNEELYVYQVKETKVVDPTNLSVLDQNRNYELTLMTCTPLGTSLNRFIVVAELVS